MNHQHDDRMKLYCINCKNEEKIQPNKNRNWMEIKFKNKENENKQKQIFDKFYLLNVQSLLLMTCKSV